MALIGLDGTEHPVDPKLVLAIEAAFRRVSLTEVAFVPAPHAWKKSNPKGSASGPKSPRKAEIKLQLAERDGFRCAYCAREFVDLDEATLDHVIPNSIVGHWQTWNLLLACEPCNSLKADKLPLVLMPLLCHLLHVIEPVTRAEKEQRKAAKRARARAARKARNGTVAPGDPATRKQRHEFYKAMRALDAPFVRLVLEAPVTRAALMPGEADR